MKHILQKHIRILLLASASIVLTACNPVADYFLGSCNAFGTEPQRITATDTKGQPLAGYKVSYQVPYQNPTTYEFGTTGREKICEFNDECILEGFYGDYPLITVSKNGYESIELELTRTESIKVDRCTSRNATANITLKPLI
jgi:hypothetical protein